ncbi:MAG: c-type cytochrome biogenesis protein CcsB [Vicinamibacteria bacterium]
MIDEQLSLLSDNLFWLALATYAASMLVFFHSFAYRKARSGTIGTALAAAATVVHAASVVTRGLAASRVPWGNMFEFISLAGLLVMAGYLLVIDRRWGMRTLGGFATGVTVLLLAGARFSYQPAGPLVPALDSYWLKIHVFAAVVAAAAFTISAVFSVLYLVADRRERRALAGPYGGSTVGAAYVEGGVTDAPALGSEDGFPDDHLVAEEEGSVAASPEEPRIPRSQRLEETAYRTIMFAFPIWTFAVIAGAIWAHEAWSRYWGWDPKETWAFITWVFYAAYLHARATAGWRGRRAAAMNLLGWTALMVNLVGVNLFIESLHSYAT